MLDQATAMRVRVDVANALGEDVGEGDLSAALLPDRTIRARVLCREDAVLCGQPWFVETFRQLAPKAEVTWLREEGEVLEAGALVCEVHGPARSLVTAERTAINFLQILSGVATTTAAHVAALEGQSTKLLDTRKTIPGLRLAQKYAVRCGGGHNHRIGLFDAYLLKENHIEAAGSIRAAVARAKDRGVLIEVEVENLDQLREAIDAGAERAMLDNFSLADLKAAVELAAGEIELEASGNMRLENLALVAATGVDYISVGALTKHVRAIDYSMRVTDADTW